MDIIRRHLETWTLVGMKPKNWLSLSLSLSLYVNVWPNASIFHLRSSQLRRRWAVHMELAAGTTTQLSTIILVPA